MKQMTAMLGLLLLSGCRESAPSPPVIEDARVRLLPQGSGALYFRVTSSDDRLVEVRSPLCSWMDLHETIHEGDVARMRSVPAFEVARGEPLVLEPHGKHVMARCQEVPPNVTTLPITLRFDRAGTVKTDARVMKASEW